MTNYEQQYQEERDRGLSHSQIIEKHGRPAAHTPGPWRIGDAGWSVFEPPTGGTPKLVASVTNKANARLIAAAPELLAALKEYVDRHEADCMAGQKPNGLPEYDQAIAAIAKAEGGAA